MHNWQCLWPQSKAIIDATAKITPRFCRKLPPIFQLKKNHCSQRLGYQKSRREETITAKHQRALQKDHICLMVIYTPEHIRTNSGWVQKLPHTTTIFVQARKRDKASRNQTTTREVGNKHEKFPNSAPKYQNWSQPSNNWFMRSQPKAIIANPQEGDMDSEQAPHLLENLKSPTNEIVGVQYCVG